MEKDKKDVSPFAAFTYQEQQDRWLEWRSRQLEYTAVEKEQPAAPIPLSAEAEEQVAPLMPSFGLSSFQRPAPTHHRELDEVLKRHSRAQKRAVHFRPLNAAIDGAVPAAADESDTPHS